MGAGGLDFTNAKTLNECLLSKWIFKLERGDENICMNMLRKKYLGDKGLQAVKEKCLRGLKYVVRNGKKARFWLDVWLGECPLKICFPILYDACLQQTWSAYQVLHEGVVDLTFRRAFGERELLEWEQLLGMVEGFVLTHEADSVNWTLEKTGVFTTASLYRELFFPGVINRELMDVWGASLPLKIKRWAILCKAEEKLMVDEAVQRLKDQLSLLRSEAGD
ncbi:hypothetical protein PAHAL_2G217500 [Panicum hallii]|uniref:Reverse transcriptase zinc-binding domain-containing protein n=1 Tax=Panicum hallii TaxID=206008 RepID=A0A2T8KQ20_9POAL|nr:hypothetical protein PAHAL_2G217500 [Panicum hallii]